MFNRIAIESRAGALLLAGVLSTSLGLAAVSTGARAASLKLPESGKSKQSAEPDLTVADDSIAGTIAIVGLSQVGGGGTLTETGVGVAGVSGAKMGVFGKLLNGSDGGSQGAHGLAGVNALDVSPAGAYTYAMYASSANNVAVAGYSNNAAASFVGGREGTGRCNFYGGSGFECSSDRALKEDFRPIDEAGLLKAVVAMPEWNYQFRHGDGTRFIGPTAQDFHAAFGVGMSDTMINTANAQGVALAAIKAMAHIIEQKGAEIASLKQSQAALAVSVAKLEQRLDGMEHQSARQARFLPSMQMPAIRAAYSISTRPHLH